MIIWGNRTKREGRGFVLRECPFCGRDQVHFVAESKTKFTLYFVPTFTTSTKALLICTNCEREEEVDGPQAQMYLGAALPRHLMLAQLRRQELGANPQGSTAGPQQDPSSAHALAVGMIVMALQVALADGNIDDGEATAVRRGMETIYSATKSRTVRDAAGLVMTDFEGILGWIRSPSTGPLESMLAQTGRALSQSAPADQSRYVGQLAWLCDKVIPSHKGQDSAERDLMDAGFLAMGFDAHAVADALAFCDQNGG